MATMVDAPTEQKRLERLRDEVLRGFWRKGGRACAADLANELDVPTSARELTPVLEMLAQEKIIREVDDPRDPRKYERPDQTIYELV